jgi:hypothetical protein
MFIEKFVEFFDNLIKCSLQTKENISKSKNNNVNDFEIINDYNLEDKSKKYIEKHITSLINTPLKKFLENKPNEKYSTYLKFVQNIYCDISELSNIFSNFKSLKMLLKLYFITMRTLYYNNQKFVKVLDSNESLAIFIDFFFKDIFLNGIKIFNNIDINNKSTINEINIDQNIIKSFIGESLPFIKKENNEENLSQIPLDILYNISDYRYDIMKDLTNKGMSIEKYFEKQKKYLNYVDNNNNKYLCVIIFFLDEIKEKYFVDRFIKYLELNDEDKKIVLSKIINK